MPYIKKEERPKFKTKSRDLGHLAECAGDLNYIITEMTHAYLKKKGKNYANINELIGALECCKLELYRKVAAPYEDFKVLQNGDVGLEDPEDKALAVEARRIERAKFPIEEDPNAHN